MDARPLHTRVSRLRNLDCCAVSDALDQLKLAGVVSGVPQQSGTTRVAGAAITVKLGIGSAQPGPPRHLGTAAIEMGGPDNVIVIEQRTGIDAGSWGGLLTLGAKVRGINGVVCDGSVRDIDEARAHGFPIFARALTAVTARGRLVEQETNTPVIAWGVAVSPGDFVIADGSAVIFIAAANIDVVLERAEQIVQKEASMAKAILSGVPISKVMGSQYEHMLRA